MRADGTFRHRPPRRTKNQTWCWMTANEHVCSNPGVLNAHYLGRDKGRSGASGKVAAGLRACLCDVGNTGSQGRLPLRVDVERTPMAPAGCHTETFNLSARRHCRAPQLE